ncbi:MBL fold metallo-hydrolase [bacterium]|nr:MBL fold metallo-hydrolase [bacterium]
MQVDLSFFPWGSCRSPAALVLSGAGWNTLEQPVLVGVLRHPQRGHYLIDTGTHPRLWQQNWSTRLFLWLARMHIPAGPPPVPILSGIFLSHFHFDHAAGLLDFPDLPVVTSRAGYAWGRQPAGRLSGWCNSLMPADLERRATWVEDLPQRQCGPVSGGDLFGDGSVLTVSLPGHAVGQHGLLCQTERGRVFFVADAAAHSQVLIGNAKQRLPCLIASDRPAERRTRAFLRGLRNWCTMVPSHCPVAYSGWDCPKG